MKKITSLFVGSAATLLMLGACKQTAGESTSELKSGLDPNAFDTVIAVAYDGTQFVPDTVNAQQVKLFTLTNANGMEVSITNFGGRIVSIMVPNKDNEFVDVACGFDKVENYFPWNFETDYGCSVGRYANRIDGGTYVAPESTDTVKLALNNNDHASLHGGYTGWQYQVYEAVEQTGNSLTLKRVSPDGDNQFPGNLTATVKFELTDNNEIVINYDAETDAPTVINMTNHTYFNLSGDLNNTIDESILMVNADNFTPGDDFLIPTGEIRSVEGTVFDFRTAKPIGQDMNSDDEQLVKAGGGYDHNWCLNTKDESEIAVTMTDPRSGIRLDVYTNEPGIQCYTANFQDGTRPGKGGIMYQKHCAICLESQKYPDSPNKYNLEGWERSNPFITPDKPYHSYCKFAFSVEK